MPVYYSQFNSSLGNKLNNIQEELNMEPTNTIEENTMETITNTEVKNFTTEQLEEFIVKEQQEITIMLNEVQEVESQTVEVNSQIDVLKEEHRQELIKQADALIILKEEATVKLSAAKAVLADRKSVLRELKDSTYWPNGYTNSTVEEEATPEVTETIVAVTTKEESFTGTTINIGGRYFLIEKPLKGRALTPIINALKSIDKETALSILNNNLADYITDAQYQRIKKKLDLEDLVLSEDEEIDSEFEEVQNKESCDKNYGPNGEELPF